MSGPIIYPRISDILPFENLPDGLEGVKEALESVFNDLYAKDFFAYTSPDGTYGHYSLKVLFFTQLGIDLPFLGGDDSMKLVINPTVSDVSPPFFRQFKTKQIMHFFLI